MMLAGFAIAVSGFSTNNLLAVLCIGAVLVLLESFFKFSPRTQSQLPVQSTTEEAVNCSASSSSFRLYRQVEIKRVIASLLAKNSILIAGEEGSGKSTLASTVVQRLEEDNFTVVYCEPATPKQMLVEIAEQLNVSTYSLDGKALCAERLKYAIATYLENNTAILIIDNAHDCDKKFRIWLKQLGRMGVPILLLATRPPRTDVFARFPRIELPPLPEYAIRELMEQTALEKGINLRTHDLARLQERVGGNPMLAIRVIEEEYLGLEVEAGDHTRYFDATPLILLVSCVFVVMRFIALGTHNPAMYAMTGAAGALFMGVSYAMRALPKEDKHRI